MPRFLQCPSYARMTGAVDLPKRLRVMGIGKVKGGPDLTLPPEQVGRVALVRSKPKWYPRVERS